MTHDPFAQIALNGNPESQTSGPSPTRFLQNRLFHPPRFASCLNGSAIFHGRLFISIERMGGHAATLIVEKPPDLADDLVYLRI